MNCAPESVEMRCDVKTKKLEKRKRELKARKAIRLNDDEVKTEEK